MQRGEATAVDGRDVERIPARADRIVVTMVDGEPRISYIDTDAKGSAWVGSEGKPVGPEAQVVGVEWQQESGGDASDRVVAGSGAAEPQRQPAQTEWTRALPEDADFAVVEVRDGEPHLVFLDVEGREVTQIADRELSDRASELTSTTSQKEPVR
ncbi:hypothetical protein [Knoellia subterranea]|uniref:Uncharacterized protein n=1 Tax=Knoellia subterranea KCTC 19937 TaxID=1385521 RepID=A0A0A0JHD6_9MICO|nr:hypothetical protein [Knoellia subterranea]KGN36169.1 hypothetical protein N803_06160 [Knoellia subterranea KCTC 19937]